MGDIGFGICGMGRMGKVHLGHFTAAGSGFAVVALCDREFERAAGPAAEYGCAADDSFAAFLARPDLELVIIATRSVDHAANAEQALRAGKVVLLEKPIGVSDDDHRLLRRLVDEHPGRLFFCHNHRFEPAFEHARAIIAGGLIGEVHLVKLRKHHAFMRRNDWQMRLDAGGGQLSVWGPHLIDQGLQLLGSPLREVRGSLDRILTPGDGDDHVSITLFGTGGRVVEIEITNAAALHEPYCTAYGDRGALRYGQDQREIELRYLDPDFTWPAISADPGPGRAMTTDPELPWREERRRVTPEINMWAQVEIELVRHLQRALRGGVPFPVTSAQALEVLRVSQLVRQQNPQFAWA